MRYKRFSGTKKRVSVLGFGGMRFDPKNEELAVRSVLRAVDLGINYFDTAPGYCDDKSETFIGKALASLSRNIRDEIFVSTKSSINADPTADAVQKRIEGQLKKLNCESIDFYNMWSILDLDQFRRIMAPNGPYKGAVQARKEGLIKHLCFTTHASGEEIVEIVKTGAFEGVTLGYNVLNHEFRKLGMKAAAAEGMGVVTMNPLGGGMLTRDAEKLYVLKENEEDSFIAAALRFNLSHPEITVVLSGMKNPGEVEENVKTAEATTGPDLGIIMRIREKFESLGESFCTSCRYCLEHCPENIQIHLFAAMWDRVRMKMPEEALRMFHFYSSNEDFWLKGSRPWDCTECGECEKFCTQHLSIREYMRNIADFLITNTST
ncbi:MAG: aldo/keto reductase [Candidatus Aminicenantes bacterium]|nr:aldo/keto reductase [Candidatus Aminicenantes bacterium]